jgi:hypothetical protein
MSYFFIETPEASLIFVGTAKPTTDGCVWLCTPAGKRLLKLPARYVHEGSPDEMAARLNRDIESGRTEMN